MNYEDFYPAFVVLQLIHSQEEIWTGFHNKWFLFTMPRWVFIGFEIVLSVTILAYLFLPNLPSPAIFKQVFIFVMLLNGFEHTIWALVKKSYVPGLVTAPGFIILFLGYLFL
jgi:hypothetical protein